MQYQIQSLELTTGYICRECRTIFTGQYVFLNGVMYINGQRSCSFWLVRSTSLNQTFDYFSEV